MTAVHFGSIVRCTTCGIILGRGDQKHGCVERTLQRLKKSTLTMTSDEEREFEGFFLKGKGQACDTMHEGTAIGIQ